METKLKWFQSDQISTSLLKKFSTAIADHPFKQDGTRGFFVTKTRSTSITAKFIEKISGNRELVDPFGNRIQLPFVTYEILQFRISSEFPHLELLNPSKSPKKLFFFLTEITRESFGIAPAEVDVKTWILTIASVFGKADISHINYSDVMVSPNVAADINFYGGGDVVGDAQNFVGRRSSNIVSAKVVARVENRDTIFEIARSGTLRANVALDGRAIDELRGTLSRSVRG